MLQVIARVTWIHKHLWKEEERQKSCWQKTLECLSQRMYKKYSTKLVWIQEYVAHNFSSSIRGNDFLLDFHYGFEIWIFIMVLKFEF